MKELHVLGVRQILDRLTQVEDAVERQLQRTAFGAHDQVVADRCVASERFADHAVNRQHEHDQADTQGQRQRGQNAGKRTMAESFARRFEAVTSLAVIGGTRNRGLVRTRHKRDADSMKTRLISSSCSTRSNRSRDLHSVGDHQQRDLLVATRVANQIEHGLGADRIDVRGRFVGQQQLRFSGQGAGDRNTLLLPDRQLAGPIMGAVGQADASEQTRAARAES